MAGLVERYVRWLARRRRVPSQDEVGSESSALMKAVAEGLYRKDVRAGGWAADLGSLGPKSYLGEAARVLDGIALGTVQDGPPTP
jgi:hypothetical protein